VFDFVNDFHVSTAHHLDENATASIAHFPVSLASSVFQWNTLLLAECSLRRRLALPESRKNAHSALSN
jgi:hypothetical protein